MQVDGLKGSGRNRGVMKDSATRVRLMMNALVNQMAMILKMELGVGMRKEILRALQLPWIRPAILKLKLLSLKRKWLD